MFLFQTNLNLEVKDSFNHVNDIRYRIAVLYRQHIEALQGRAKVMSEVFQREIGYLTTYFSKRKKDAK